jgi:hypothetical protein
MPDQFTPPPKKNSQTDLAKKQTIRSPQYHRWAWQKMHGAITMQAIYDELNQAVSVEFDTIPLPDLQV